MSVIVNPSRRQFIIGAASALAIGGGITGYEVSKTKTTKTTIGSFSEPKTSAILVLLTLYGGNDGLNTVVPFQDPLYSQLRGPMALKNNQVLPLGTDNLWLNSSLKNILELYKQNKVAIVRGVSYPNPSLSHFVSMAIWQSAVTSDSSSSGWIGRYLDQIGSNDPMQVLCLGTNVPLACVGNQTQASAISVAGTPVAPFPSDPIAYSSMMDNQGLTQMPKMAANEGSQLLSLDAQLKSLKLGGAASVDLTFTDLPGQLEAVSQLIDSGAGTQIYSVSESSFDTHADEVTTQNALWAKVDDAIGKFFAGLKAPFAQNVTLVAYSEFGRRVASNASLGTDHGTSGPVFVIGDKVKGGMYGEQPSLSKLIDGNLATSVDFRSVYSTIIEDVLGHSSKDFLNGSFPNLKIIHT